MKKVFTLFGMVSLICAAQAQEGSHHTFTVQTPQLSTVSNSGIQQLDENVTVKPLPTDNYLNRGGGPIWSEDFENGFPDGWGIEDVSGYNAWKWSTEGYHGFFNGTDATDYTDAISSTTGDNGFLINDPDSANHFTNGQPASSNYVQLPSYFATNEIDLGGSFSSLLLEFEQSFRYVGSVDLLVQVSPDSVNWTDYTVQGGVAANDASDDPELVSINISGALDGSQSVFLRIGWSAIAYYWMIDDMRIVQGLDNDMAMRNVWHGDIIEAWEYQKIPLSQATEVVIGASSVNQGGFAQPNAVYTYDISNESGTVDSGTFAANNDSIVSSDGDTTWHATGFTPTEIGVYTVSVSVASDSSDAEMSNNDGESSFEITQFVYGHDDEDNIVFQINGGDDSAGDANEFKMAMYYEVVEDVMLTSVQVAFGNNTNATSCIVEVFNASTNQGLDDPIADEVYDLQSGDISPGANPNLVNILIEDGDGELLEAGNVYLISVGNTSVGEDLWFLASAGDEDRAQLRYGPYGAGGAIDWYTGYTTSPLIRINTDPTVDVVETAIEDYGYGIYPNPTSDVLNVTVNREFDINDITIVDVTGKVVRNIPVQSLGEKFAIDVSHLNSGVYFVNATSNKGVSSQKLIIQ